MLCHHRNAYHSENKRNPGQAEDLEGHPVVRAEGSPGDFVGNGRGQEHHHPDPADGAPARLRQAKLRSDDRAKRVPADQPAAGNDRRKKAGQDRRLDLDEEIIVEPYGKAAEERHRHTADKRHHRDASFKNPAGSERHQRGTDKHLHRKHEIAGGIVGGEEQNQRPQIKQEFPARAFVRGAFGRLGIGVRIAQIVVSAGTGLELELRRRCVSKAPRRKRRFPE